MQIAIYQHEWLVGRCYRCKKCAAAHEIRSRDIFEETSINVVLTCVDVIVDLFGETRKHVVFGRFVRTDGIAFIILDLATTLEEFGTLNCWSGVKSLVILTSNYSESNMYEIYNDDCE
jgi:hypothetical protein